MGWLVLALVVLSLPIFWASQLLARALPKAEAVDFAQINQWRRCETDAGLVRRLVELPGPVGEFARAGHAALDAADRVDVLCERLAEVDTATKSIAAQLSMLTRTVLAAGGFIGIIALISATNEYVSGGFDPARSIVAVFPLGLSGVVAFRCHWIGRAISSRIQERRRAWDRLCRLLEGPHMSGLDADPAGELSQQTCRRDSECEESLALRR